ncbi:MAG: hypothetical protein P9L94_16410 [Candidatus Hinthialibacter antarcticus]|nr:hypothetical protein [Candidatus Hinthialibacter antarcticus]
MKRLPILALGGALALCVFSGAALAETIEANDTPDIVLPLGPDGTTLGTGAFDLGDFFSSDENAAVDISVEGSASVTDGVVSIPSQDTAGEGSATFTAGAEVATTNIYYSDFMIEARPNAGNLFAGMSPSNFLLQGIVPGQAASGSIGTLPADGGASAAGGSPSGGATLIATIGEMGLTEGVTGLRTRTIGDVGDSVGGLSVSLDASGAYTITSDASFDGPAVVSLGAQSGASTDVVQLYAAPAQSLDVTSGWNGGSIASIAFAAGGDANFIVGPAVSSPGDAVTLVMTYTTTTTDIALALIGFDGTDFLDLYFTNPKNAGLAAGETHTLILTMSSIADQVQCGLQVTPGATAGTVSVKSYQVLNSPALTSLAVNPNATLAGMPDGSMADGLAGWTTPVNAGEVGGVLNAGNNFATATSAGSALLNGTASPSNLLMILNSVSAGVVSVETYAKRVSGDAGNLLLLIDDGGVANSLAASRAAAKIPTDSWAKIEASTAIADSGFSFVVAQAAGGCELLVDDFSVRVWADGETFFDSRLAGL